MPEESLLDAMRRYEEKGYDGQFSVRPDALIHCHACGADEPAAQTPVAGMHRFEGESDPGEEAVLLALECLACGGWGTMTMAYGPGQGPDDQAALAELLDARDLSTVQAGT